MSPCVGSGRWTAPPPVCRWTQLRRSMAPRPVTGRGRANRRTLGTARFYGGRHPTLHPISAQKSGPALTARLPANRGDVARSQADAHALSTACASSASRPDVPSRCCVPGVSQSGTSSWWGKRRCPPSDTDASPPFRPGHADQMTRIATSPHSCPPPRSCNDLCNEVPSTDGVPRS